MTGCWPRSMRFAATARQFFSAGGKGLNVTVPFKRAAWAMVAAHAGGALDAEAVNTITRVGDDLVGYNTDGIGLVADIEQNLRLQIRGQTRVADGRRRRDRTA